MCLLGECIFSQQRERERKREKVFRVLLLLLLREGDDDQYFLVSNKLKPVFLSFCLFWREFVMKNMFWAFLWWKKKYAERGRSRTSLVFFTFVSHSLVRNVRCFCADSKAMMTTKIKSIFWSFTAYLIIASALSLRTYIRDTFFSLIRSLTQYFLHTHKNTHTDAHRKHSFRWKHAGCIERKHILW